MDRLIKWDREDGYQKDKDRDKDRHRDRDRDREKDKEKGRERDRDNVSENSFDGQKDDNSRYYSVLGDGNTNTVTLRGTNNRPPLGLYSTSSPQGGGEVGGALTLAYASVGDEKDREFRERDRERDRDREKARERGGDGGKSSVPTRQTVKEASSQALEEAKRKSNLALRKKRYRTYEH